jgi:choice-of-anchor B domain-containing protein
MRRRTFLIATAVLPFFQSAAPAAGQGFGQTVLVAGDELLVGESLFQDRPGTVYVYRKNAAGRWAEAGRLQASDAEPNDHFGRALAIAEGDLLVGSTISRESGALYVFQRGMDGTWRESAALVPSDAQPDHSFGRMAATDGRTVFMSDWAADSSRGAVYVFEKREGEWRETAKLAPDDREPNDWFGASVAIAGDRLAVGARNRLQNRGVAYVFQRGADGEWTQVDRISPPDTAANLQFGAGIALVGDALLVGAPGADQFIGAVYAYRANEGSAGWTLAGRVAPPAGTPQSNSFGNTLTVSGDEVWVGTPGVEAGLVYRLTRGADGQWTNAGALAANDLEPGDGFGGALAVSEDVAIAGVVGDDFGMGSVVVLERRSDVWTPTDRLMSEVEGLEPVTGGRVDCAGGKAVTFACNEVDLVSFLPVEDIGGGRGVRLNDVWGWTDPQTGTEWAIVGRVDGTSFIDLSDPARPRYVGDLPMHAGSRANAWRDIKVYQNHAYIVADGAGDHGVQVFDLTRLRTASPAAAPVAFTEDAHYDRVASSHNIVINEATGFAYAVGVSSGGETCGGGLHMIDIREPKNPKFAGCFQDRETGNQRTGYSHDAQCVLYHGPDETYRGREICLGSNETALSVADVTDKANPIAISRASYPNVGYAHQGWFDEQHEYFYMDDEGDEVSGTVQHTRTLVWDLKDLDDPVLIKEYLGPSTSSDHNLYVVGNTMYQSNYVSGLRVVDIANRAEPREVGFFDTVSATDDPGFDGSWSNYPFFASGTIVVTSGKEGVFFLRKRETRPIS